MDPNATYTEMIKGFDDENEARSTEAAANLAIWLLKGGFWPTIASKSLVLHDLERALGNAAQALS